MTPGKSFSRRTFLKGASAAAVAGTTAVGSTAAVPSRGGQSYGTGTHPIELKVNGATHKLQVEPRTTLLDALRDHLEFTGAKQICDRGACGGCTVLVDREAVNSCMMLAFDAVDADIMTVEGLASPSDDNPFVHGGGTLGAPGDEDDLATGVSELHPLQSAFVECDALQCGFCTPGMLMAGLACLNKHGKPTRAQIRHEMTGNICRCGTYGRVFDAIEKTANQPAGKQGAGR